MTPSLRLMSSRSYLFHSADPEEGRKRLRLAGQDGSVLPVVVMYTGEVLADPSTEQLAAAFGVADLPTGPVDVAIVGAGPAGLSAAACEGPAHERSGNAPADRPGACVSAVRLGQGGLIFAVASAGGDPPDGEERPVKLTTEIRLLGGGLLIGAGRGAGAWKYARSGS